ncbi:hypothetical protein ACQ33O_02660 [Ferruginibacter sp. SUN002]|uniref:hypothetical protein n=1 Tax=Ferruginibacter sp. SUN002 TaxID=2937789 RepID=UPI003D35FE74
MKKTFITCVICVSSFFICKAQSSLDLTINDKLIYLVNVGGDEYDFTLKIKSLAPAFTFAWQMTNEDFNYGRIEVTPTAMDTSKKMHNYFINGSKTLTDATSVTLSKAAYKEIVQNKKVSLWDGDKEFVFENSDETIFAIEINGDYKTVEAFYLSDENRNDIVVLKNPNYPLILRMNIGWSINLSTIIPAGKTTTDLSTFISKEIAVPSFLYEKLSKSSVVATKDLTEIGVPEKPNTYTEYFSHIEGLNVKTHNDTVTDIIYYPTQITHNNHTYYGGDISIPQLSSYIFNRATAKKFIKAKFVKTSSYDTDIYEASNGTIMELHYTAPKKTIDGIEFVSTNSKTPKTKQALAFITFRKK